VGFQTRRSTWGEVERGTKQGGPEKNKQRFADFKDRDKTTAGKGKQSPMKGGRQHGKRKIGLHSGEQQRQKIRPGTQKKGWEEESLMAREVIGEKC